MHSSDSDSELERRRKERKKQTHPDGNVLIVKEVLRVLGQGSLNHHEMHMMQQKTPLILKEIERRPYYLADDMTCIQAQLKAGEPQQLNPFNILETQYYAAHSKPHIVFNCHEQVLEGGKPIHPSAYHPAYHYKSYDQFEEKRKITKVSVSCEVYHVLRWSVQIVNISKSGYYAPLLILHEFRKVKGSNVVMNQRVQNILFSQALVPFLDEFRVKDMRTVKVPIQKNMYSLVYYTKDRKQNQKCQKMSKFSNIDTKCQILATNHQLPINFVAFGELSQYQLFKRPLHPKYLYKKKQINLDRYIEEENRGQADISFEDNSNSSSFIECDGQNIENDRNNAEQNLENQIQRLDIEDDESIEAEDDYLKTLYAKAMRNDNYM